MFGLPLPNALFTGHLNAKADTSRGLSPQLWQRAANSMLPPNGMAGFMVGDDFGTFSGISATSGSAVTVPLATAFTSYAGYFDIGSSLTRVADKTGGIVRLATDTTDNDLAIFGTGDLFEISRVAGEKAVTIFEARISRAAVAAGSVFIGLASTEVIADGGLIADSGELIAATGDGIGFRTLEADPDELDFIYKARGQTTVEKIDGVQALTAGTFYKVGFVYDPQADASQRIAVYVDGVKQSTYVTDTNMAAATFPDSDYLAFVAAAMGDTTACSLDIDWWAAYQGPIIG